MTQAITPLPGFTPEQEWLMLAEVAFEAQADLDPRLEGTAEFKAVRAMALAINGWNVGRAPGTTWETLADLQNRVEAYNKRLQAFDHPAQPRVAAASA